MKEEFLKRIEELREEKCVYYTLPSQSPKEKFIVLDEYLETSTVVDSVDEISAQFSYVIPITEVRWRKAGYINGGYVVLGMFNNKFNQVEEIPFSNWAIESVSLHGSWGGMYDKEYVSLSLKCINRQILKKKEVLSKTLDKMSGRSKYSKILFKKHVTFWQYEVNGVCESEVIHMDTVTSSGLNIRYDEFGWFLKIIWLFESLFNEAFSEVSGAS